MAVDYSLYLVTDNTPAILGNKDLVVTVEQAILGGVTIVQLRDKTSETSELIRVANALHKVCLEHKVPLIINDRLDVALASNAEGIHIGQDDIDIGTARALYKALGKEAIIGVTVNSEAEALKACEDGADYLGIGTVFATATKENSKSIIGISGLQHILSKVHESSPSVKTVCIGGINASNIQRVMYQCTPPSSNRSVDGVAIVSAIMAVSDPRTASASLLKLVHSPPPFATSAAPSARPDLTTVPSIIARLAATKPLAHNMTNLVVQNIAANVALAIGGSPIMSTDPTEAADLASLGGSLVVNMGSATPAARDAHLAAVKAYNAVGGSTLLDPVGAGATAMRREGTRLLLAGGYWDVIKGNEGEIRTVAGEAVRQKGVDSGVEAGSLQGRAELVKRLAQRERDVVLMTGAVDVVSDGKRTVAIHNGHPLLGEITGSGCTLGTTVACVLAVEREDKLLAVLAAVLAFEIAGERAAAREAVRGPGTFVPAFLDELYLIREESVKGETAWIDAAKIEWLD